MDILLKKAPSSILVRQTKCITQSNFSVCWLNIKSFYCGLTRYIFSTHLKNILPTVVFTKKVKQGKKMVCNVPSLLPIYPYPGLKCEYNFVVHQRLCCSRQNTDHLLIQLKFLLRSNDLNFIRPKGCI